MSLKERVQKILNDFEISPSEEILQALEEIKDEFKSELTRDYLKGKINPIKNISEESEKKKLCKNLAPYLDWYLQGTI